MHDLTADLPPPRDDEPGTLRQDIADELADHLECALRREQLTSGAASGGRQPSDLSATDSAWQRVLTRFGNPKTIARQLWLDAMKERLMAQRLSTFVTTIAALACVAACFLMWRIVQDNRDAQAALLSAQQEQFAELLVQFGEPGEASDESANWAPLKVRLVDEAGQPMQGKVFLLGGPLGISNTAPLRTEVESDEMGNIELGMLPYGQYELSIRVHDPSAQTETAVLHGPGWKNDLEIICPSKLPELTTMQVEVSPPAELRNRPLAIVVELTADGKHEFAGREWRQGGIVHTNLLFDSQGKIQGALPQQLSGNASREFPIGQVPDLTAQAYGINVNLAVQRQVEVTENPDGNSTLVLHNYKWDRFFGRISAVPGDVTRIQLDADHPVWDEIRKQMGLWFPDSEIQMTQTVSGID